MPEPNRARYRIETQLQGLRMWEIVDRRQNVVVMCDACPNFRIWKPHDLRHTFARQRNTRIEDVAEHLKCRRCGSNWLRIGMAN